MKLSGLSAKRRTVLLLLPALCLLIALAYGRSLSNGFVWDDDALIVNNPYVHDLSRWPEYFSVAQSITSVPVMSRLYRPLQTLSFAIDMALWKGKASGFHLTSLLLHIACCLAIVFVFQGFVGLEAAWIAACIFAVHPAISEGALSLASRGNQLYTLFSLLAIGLFGRIKRKFDLRHIFCSVFFLPALFSKEPAIAAVALLPVIQAAIKHPWPLRDRRSVLLYAPILAATGAYLLIRSKTVETGSALPYWGGSLWNTLQMQAKVFVIYLRLLVWPFILKARYTIQSPGAFPDFEVLGAVLLNLALAAVAVLCYRGDGRKKMASLAIAWFYISLAPVSNLIPLPGSMMGERFLYFTAAGVIPLLCGALAVPEWKKYAPVLMVPGCAVLIAWLATDMRRTVVWKDNITFFSLLSEQEPLNPVVQVRMAQEELAQGNAISALQRLERVVRGGVSAPLAEDRAGLHYWYARALLAANRPQEAYNEFATVAQISGTHSKELVLFMAEAAARSGNLYIARGLLEREANASPRDDAIWNGLGNVFLMMNQIPSAIQCYEKALKINPQNQEAALNLQNALEHRLK